VHPCASKLVGRTRQPILVLIWIEIFGTLTNGDTLLVRATDERKPGSLAYWRVTRL
jgi:hypothetical protein